ncbi:MAG: preprotein translocase subunit YajC [Sphingomonadales bacterium]|nr:preprotein translocase subunit YajC [Sphingomonadales bacterium]MBD3774589.1 preprotein translocase subunit YajC [Paracoccaceae bacterium]
MKQAHLSLLGAPFALVLALAGAAPAVAQSWGDEVTGGGEGGGDGAPSSASPTASSGGRRVALTPYLEVSQVVLKELSPGDDTVTYTQVAAGVDASVQGRNNGGSVSIRYERNFGWNANSYDSDTITGVARGYATVVPQALTVEGGALAARTRVDASGSTTLSPLDNSSAESRTYAGYIGPNLHTRAGDVEVNANYRFGYTKVEAPNAYVAAPGANPVDVFDNSRVHSANLHLATRPGEPLPVGLGVGGGFYQEDISNLDQRVRDAHVRADVTVPLSPSVAVVGGVGYEDVQISSRDVLRDTNGDPVIGSDGRYVTDKSAPRQIAYDTSGLIWDVGVLWRPSTRTSFEAHVGKRYDSTTYYGSFAWAPTSRSAVNIAAYDGVFGYGGQLTNALAALPTDFQAVRNPLTGDVNGCVASLEGGSCLNGVLGSVRAATFRSRGLAATYSVQAGRMGATFGLGYDRRKFIAAPGTILAAANGKIDETYWAAIALNGQVGRSGNFTLSTYGNYFDSGVSNASAWGVGSTASYSQSITRNLSARAAVAYDFLNSDLSAEDIAAASALVGLRYDF